MTDSARRCVFCGFSGPLNKEHVFPQWTQQLPAVAKATAKRGRQVANVPIRVTQRGEDGEWHEVQRLRSPIAPGIQDVKVKCVCEVECNRGWMSDLEKRAKRLIEPMSRGPVELSEADQRTLAEWAFKTILMYAQYQPATNGFVPEVYTDFYATRRPPAGVDIHIGQCRYAVASLWTDGRWVGLPDAPIDDIMARPSVASGFIAVEGVCWFISYVSPDADLTPVARQLLSGAHFDRHSGAQRVWPPSPRLDWPPPEMSGDQVIEAQSAQHRILEERASLSPEVRRQ